MRKSFSASVEAGREWSGPFASRPGDRHGHFLIRHPGSARVFCVIASDGGAWPIELVAQGHADPWEHVSVSLPDRCPTWEEMCWVKDLFFELEETVVQFHPPASTYVNIHPYALHLWQPVLQAIPMPPLQCV